VATARAGIEAAGLVIGTLTPAPPASDDTWLVQAQSPFPGETVPLGSPVDLTLIDPVTPCVSPPPTAPPGP
jgi:hypothetical protein